MSIYKDVYWYDFSFNGERIRKSARTSNDKAARQIEAAHRGDPAVEGEGRHP
jgi:hypothetical protein